VDIQIQGYRIEVKVFSPGTHELIHSASLEPNDPPEIDFLAFDEQGDSILLTDEQIAEIELQLLEELCK
jgi:hypothetical protein